MRTILFLCLLCATAAAGNNELSVGSSIRGLPSKSADPVTSDGLAGPAFTYARALDIDWPGVEIWAQAALDIGLSQSTLFGTIDTKVSTVGLTAGALARIRVVKNVYTTGRIALGGEQTRLSLSAPMSSYAADHAMAGLARASAGVDIMFVDKPRFAFGLRVELGYGFASSVALAPTPSSSDDTLKLPMSEASLGHLDLSGPFANIGVMSQF